jgi:protein-S-isoprenylcysteine O-methyltransferase Ste14
MRVLDQRMGGIIVLVLWVALVGAKRIATGSLLEDKPRGGAWMWITHVFNFSFLLAAVPAAAILLMLREGPLNHLAAAGAVLYSAGTALMISALLTLRGNYQVGGNTPRPSDKLVIRGPYRFVRHPMYAAALSVSLGLALLTQSFLYFGVFCVYVMLIARLIPIEEQRLYQVYKQQYGNYRAAVKALLPPFF